MTAQAKAKKRASQRRADFAGAPARILWAVLCFGLAALLFYLSLAGPQEGTTMAAIRTVLRGIGGSIHPLLALIPLWLGVLLACSAAGRRVRAVNVLADGTLFLLLFTLVQLFSARVLLEQRMSLTGFANFVAQSYHYGAGGGALGALLAYPLYVYVGGEWGGTIVVALAAVLCLLLTGRAQRVWRWANARADAEQHRREQHCREQHCRERESDRLFEEPPRDRRTPPPQAQSRRPVPPRRPRAEQDYIVINGPDTPSEQRPKQPVHPYSSDEEARAGRRARRRQEEVEAPRPLRRIREERSAPGTPAEAAVAHAPAEAAPPAPAEEPDFFTVHDELPPEEAAPQPDDVGAGREPAPVPEAPELPPELTGAEKDRRRDAPSPAEKVPGPASPAADAADEPPFDLPRARASGRRNGAEEAEDSGDFVPAEPSEGEEEAYNYPPIDLLSPGEQSRSSQQLREDDRVKAEKLMHTLENFGIETRLIGIAHGPAVTRFELQPAPGVKVSRITALSDDIALGLAAISVRIEAPIPGKAAVGVEIPNDKVETVRLRDVLECPEARRHPSRLAVGLGKDNSGRYIVADIAKMPHVLIAGQTGSGKSVCINSIITSILYRATPDEVRMIMIDPKVVELSIYNDIPHLIAPVVTDPKKASSALDWAVAEMSARYKRFAERDVRDIKGYNRKLAPGEKPMPQIVIIIDELADLMMVAPGEVEDSICRLAQLARAAGMHLVIATQRPSVNVITGIIKANIPTRIAFSVASQVDSRTMIDHGGAEKLLGNGDMLYVPSGINKPLRVQGAWVSDEEVHAIVSYIKARSETDYDEDVVEQIENAARSDAEREDAESEYDPRLPEAVEIVIEAGQASTSMLQRRMRVGYARAGRLIDDMAKRGVIGEADGSKPRAVLITREQYRELFGTDLPTPLAS